MDLRTDTTHHFLPQLNIVLDSIKWNKVIHNAHKGDHFTHLDISVRLSIAAPAPADSAQIKSRYKLIYSRDFSPTQN